MTEVPQQSLQLIEQIHTEFDALLSQFKKENGVSSVVGFTGRVLDSSTYHTIRELTQRIGCSNPAYLVRGGDDLTDIVTQIAHNFDIPIIGISAHPSHQRKFQETANLVLFPSYDLRIKSNGLADAAILGTLADALVVYGGDVDSFDIVDSLLAENRIREGNHRMQSVICPITSTGEIANNLVSYVRHKVDSAQGYFLTENGLLSSDGFYAGDPIRRYLNKFVSV